MENILISACLLGVRCRYDGGFREYDLGKLRERYNLIPICPEIYGGLPTPRVPSEIVGDNVINKDGVDVTMQYEKGAKEALYLAKLFDVKKAVLKERSPSCGRDFVYDGSFSKVLKPGDGITCSLLRANGIEVFTESEISSEF